MPIGSPRIRLALICVLSAIILAVTVAAPAEAPSEPAEQVMSAAVASRPVMAPSEAFVTTTTLPPPPVTTTTTTTVPPPTTTLPPPPPQEAAPAAVGNCGGLVPIVEAYWPADQVAKVCDVMDCETHGTFSATAENPDSTASGVLQFLDGTWRSARGYVEGASQYARAMHAPIDVQIHVGAEWWAATSWSQWECA